jgi:hypothetical protein
LKVRVVDELVVIVIAEVVEDTHQRTPPESAVGVTTHRGAEANAAANDVEPEVAPDIVTVPEGFDVPVPPFMEEITPVAPATGISPQVSVAKQ